VHAAKLYPAGATTNSDSGVTSIDKIFPAIEAMAEVGMPLLMHGEVTRGDVDVFDRESASSMSTCAVWSSVSRR
jgi:dihydroorotase